MFKSHELIGFMSPALAKDIVGYLHESDKPSYKATLAAVAQARHLRPVFLERQARDQQHTAIIATLSKPTMDMAAGTLLRSWLVKKHAPMLEDFLNALEIKNEKGVVEDLPASVDDAKLKAAVDALLAKYPPEVVSVYLHAFSEMNEANWTNLKTLLESDTRLQLGNHD